MAIQIIPNLQAQKGAIEHQNRMQLMGQALQSYGEQQQQQFKRQKMAEAYKKMGLPEEVMYAPESLQQLAYKEAHPAAPKPISAKDQSVIDLNTTKINEINRKAQDEQNGKLTSVQRKQIEKLDAEIKYIKEKTRRSKEDPIRKMFAGRLGMPEEEEEDEEEDVTPPSYGKGIIKPELIGKVSPPISKEPKAKAEPKAKVGAPEGIPKEEGVEEGAKPSDPYDVRTWTDAEIDEFAALDRQQGIAGVMGRKASAERKRRKEEAEKAEKKTETERKESREERLDREKREHEEKLMFHKESKDDYEKIIKAADEAEEKNRALTRIEKAIPKVTKRDQFVSTFLKGSKYEDFFKSQNAAEIDANIVPLLKGWREVMGGVLSDKDVNILLQKMITSTKSPETNKRILDAMRMENDIVIARRKYADQIIRENKGFRPYDFKAQIDERVAKDFGDEIRATRDEIMSLPDDVKEKDKFVRRKVHPGTKMPKDVMDAYLDAAERNPDKRIPYTKLAREWAIEDNYDLSK